MIKTKSVLKEEAAKVICDKCHKDCGHPDEGRTLSIRAHWGYGSKFDCDKWSADLCSDCALELKEFMPNVITVIEYALKSS